MECPMRWRGVSHVEFAVLDYDRVDRLHDAMGWLGYSSFSSLNMEYQSVYRMTIAGTSTRTATSASSPRERG